MGNTKILLVCLLAALTAGAALNWLSKGSEKHFSSEIYETFARWKLQHGRLYASPSENDFRLNVFSQEIAFVQKSNVQYEAKMAAQGEKLSGPMFEMNKFGDLTKEEFRAKYTGDVPPTQEYFEERSPSDVPQITPALQSGLGFGFVPKVRSQGICGACYAFSAVVEMERLVYWKQGGQYIDLSVQEIVDCSKETMGCNGGGSEHAYNYWLKHGLHKTSDYPYNAAEGTCQQSKPGAITVSGGGLAPSKYQVFSQAKAELVASFQILPTIGIMPDGAFKYFSKTDDVFDGRNHEDCHIGTFHAILMLTFKGDVGRVLNSWGTDWGVNGQKSIRACSSSHFFGNNGRFVYPYDM
jgi:hypothetical protein